VPVNAYQHTKRQLPNSTRFADMEVVPKLNVGLLAPGAPRMLKLLCVVKQRAKFQHRSSMQLCEYVFAIGFPLYVPKNVVFGGFEGEGMKILCYNPQIPSMNTRLLVYCMSKSVQRPEL